VIMAEGSGIGAADLDLAGSDVNADRLNLRHARDEAERQAVLRSLAHADGNVSRAADLLGVSRPTLYDLMQRYGLK